METSAFLKRTIFTLTTGSILCYLISFHSVGQTRVPDKTQMKCRTELLQIRSGRPVALRYQDEVTAEKLGRLTPLEQNLVREYIKKTGHQLIQDGIENPFFLTTYRMESPTRKLLGYKVVVDTILNDDDIMTYYLTQKKQTLFWYLEMNPPEQSWSCEI